MQWSERIGRRLKPRDLHVFLAVAEAGNMAKAAEQLAISRPVVSKTIADLEHTLGVRLLDRTPKGVEPTPYGRALLKRSLAVFDELRQSVKEIECLADPSAGELRIGLTEVPAAGMVPAAIDRLWRQYPRMTVRTEQGSADDVLNHLRQRKCEVGVVRLPLSAAPDMDFQALHCEQLFVVAGSRSRWARQRRIGLADLKDEPWVQSYLEMEAGSPIAEAFRAAGVERPRTVVLSNSANLRFGLLATGRFLTMFPDSLVRYGPERAAIRILPIKLPRWQVPTSAVTLKDRTLSPIAQHFIDCLRELARPLEKAPGPIRAAAGSGAK
jgi:DNA-binding transcriptional LysR family regulator